MPSLSTVPLLKLPGLESIKGRRDLSPFTRIGMTFYPHRDDPVFPYRGESAISVTWDKKKTQGALQSFSFSKVLGQAAGGWAATVKDSHPYQLDVGRGDILPGDWCDVFVLRNGVEIPVCRGVVDVVKLRRVGIGGATVREWHLEGRDHGAPWESPVSYNNMWVHTMREIIGGIMTDRVRGEIGGSPGRMFKLLCEACFSHEASASYWMPPECMPFQNVNPDEPWEGEPLLSDKPEQALAKKFNVPAGYSFIDGVKMVIGATRGGYYNEPLLWHQAGQTGHQMITDWCNPQLNEIVYDLAIADNFPRSGMPDYSMSATIRERPFLLVEDGLAFTDPETGWSVWTGPESPWFGLPTWKLPSWVFTDIDTGRSGLERFNLFELIAEMGFGGTKMEEQAMAPPSWYRESVVRHGLKGMIETTKYVCGDLKKAGAGWVQERVNWQRMLLNWYCLNPWFLNGAAAVPLMLPEIRVGQRLTVNYGKQDLNETYYVEGQNLSYSRSGTSAPSIRSSFNITRGWVGSDRSLIDATKTVVGKYKDTK